VGKSPSSSQLSNVSKDEEERWSEAIEEGIDGFGRGEFEFNEWAED
jgi:hypothetical protein